jgi:hypothetical protein
MSALEVDVWNVSTAGLPEGACWKGGNCRRMFDCAVYFVILRCFSEPWSSRVYASGVLWTPE